MAFVPEKKNNNNNMIFRKKKPFAWFIANIFDHFFIKLLIELRSIFIKLLLSCGYEKVKQRFHDFKCSCKSGLQRNIGRGIFFVEIYTAYEMYVYIYNIYINQKSNQKIFQIAVYITCTLFGLFFTHFSFCKWNTMMSKKIW